MQGGPAGFTIWMLGLVEAAAPRGTRSILHRLLEPVHRVDDCGSRGYSSRLGASLGGYRWLYTVANSGVNEGMNITAFVANSVGRWRSQRSAHHLAFGHFEAIQSEIEIVALAPEDPAVISLCQQYGIDPALAVSPFRMSWQGQSDWDENEVQGSCVLVPIPDPSQTNHGKLLRDQGYAEAIAAIGEYYLSEDGTFVLTTAYDRAAAEEKFGSSTRMCAAASP